MRVGETGYTEEHCIHYNSYCSHESDSWTISEDPSFNARNCTINPAPNPDIYSNKINETEQLRNKRNTCSFYPECFKQMFQKKKKKILTKALTHIL